MFQIEVWKSQESFTYFKIFKPISWGKRPAERRRRFIQRFPKERVPASLRIRLSEALAKAGRAFLLSESSRDPRTDPQATVGGISVPVIEIARKPETPKAGRPIVCDRTGNCSGRLAKQLARGGARPPRSSGKTAARGACRNMALQILRAVVYLSLMTVCGTGLSPCRTNAKGTQNARENFLLHF